MKVASLAAILVLSAVSAFGQVGGAIRQDNSASIAKENGGNLATTATNAAAAASGIGATTVAKCTTTDTTACTLIGLMKELSYLLQTAAGPATATNSNPFIESYNTLVSGAITSAMTGTTSTAVGGTMTATASNYIYVTGCTTSNSSTSVPTDIILQDGSGGTTLYTLPTPSGTGTGTGASGATFVFPSPLKLTVNTALYAANVTTSSSTKISCNGFKSTISY